MASQGAFPGGKIAAIILTLVALLFGIALGLAGTFVIPEFKSVFSAFGAGLPLPAVLVIKFGFILWALPLLAAIFWWLLPSNMARIKFYAVFWAFEIILIALMVIAMYWPIFKLGSAV